MPIGIYDRTTARPVRRKSESESEFRDRMDRWASTLGYVRADSIPQTILAAPVQENHTETQLAEQIADDILKQFTSDEDIKAFWDLTRSIMAYKMKKRSIGQ